MLRPCCLFILLLLLVSAGCSDEKEGDSCTGPDGQARSGRITGRVIGGEGGIADAEVMIQEAEGARTTVIRTTTDSTGTYDVGVRPGSYNVAVLIPPPEGVYPPPSGRPLFYRSGGVVPDPDQAEPVTVTCETVHADLTGGSGKARFSLPAGVSSSGWKCELIREGEYPFDLGAYTEDSAGVQFAGFPLLPPGVYRARISGGGLSAWFQGALSSSSADTFRIEPGSSRTLESSFTAHPFQGSVTGSWQQVGRKRPEVILFGEDPRVSSALAEVETDDQGSFSGMLLGSGRVRMCVVIDQIVNWYGGGSWESAPFLEVPATGEIRFPAYVEAGLRCTIIGQGWQDARVVLESATGDWKAMLSLADSVAFFPNVTAGSCFLSILPEGPFRPQWFDRASSRDGATPIPMPEGGGVVDVAVTLERGGVLSGRVLRADGTPRGVTTRLQVRTEHFGLFSYRAASDGSFRIEGLPEGKVKLGGWHGSPEFLTWYPGTLDESEAYEFEIHGQEEIADIEFRFLP